jgi:hypothetical protein
MKRGTMRVRADVVNLPANFARPTNWKGCRSPVLTVGNPDTVAVQ